MAVAPQTIWPFNRNAGTSNSFSKDVMTLTLVTESSSIKSFNRTSIRSSTSSSCLTKSGCFMGDSQKRIHRKITRRNIHFRHGLQDINILYLAHQLLPKFPSRRHVVMIHLPLPSFHQENPLERNAHLYRSFSKLK